MKANVIVRGKKYSPEILSCIMEATCGFWWSQILSHVRGTKKSNARQMCYNVQDLVISEEEINASVSSG